MNKKISRKKLIATAGIGWMFDAMDVGLLSFILVAVGQEWNLTKDVLGWIGSINSIGMAIGASLFGIYADRKGRTKAFIFTLLIFSLASGLSAFTTSVVVFALLRFIIGIGLGGELPVAATLVSESVALKERARIVVLLESFWALGWLLAALIAWAIIARFDNGWRIALLLCALPALYAVYLRKNLPDSAKYQQLSQRTSLKQSLNLVFSKQYRRSTIMLWILWFCVVFSYYGMFLWLPNVMVEKGISGVKGELIKSYGYIVLMTLAQLPGYFSVAWLIERYGRRWILASYLIGTAIAALMFGQAQSLTMLLVSGALLSFFNLGAWGAMYAYTPELYPTAIRATGSGLAAAVGRIGGVLGPLLVGYLLVWQVAVSYIFAIFCAAIFIAVIAVLLLGKETKMLEVD